MVKNLNTVERGEKVRIGKLQAHTQADNSIVVNASDTILQAPNSGFFVAPVREDVVATTNVLAYNSTTKEIVQTSVVASDKNLQHVTDTGNITTQVVQFTNGFVASGLVRLGGNTTPEHSLDIGSNIYLDDTGSSGNVFYARGNVYIEGNLTAVGETTFISSKNISITDPIIELGQNNVNENLVYDLGVLMKRPGDNVGIVYVEGRDEVLVGYTANTASDRYVSTTANLLTMNVAGDLYANTYYGDGRTLTGLAYTVDLEDNVARIEVLETDTASNVLRVSNLETQMSSNGIRVGNLESNLAANSVRIGVNTLDILDNSQRISTLYAYHASNVIRIANLESNLTDNVYVRISDLESELADNSVRISTLSTRLADNSFRISLNASNIAELHVTSSNNFSNIATLQAYALSNGIRVSTLETSLASNAAALIDNSARISALEVNPVFEGVITGDGGNISNITLQYITDLGNTTSNTVHLTNTGVSLKTDGFVGINIEPQYELHVGGDFKATGNIISQHLTLNGLNNEIRGNTTIQGNLYVQGVTTHLYSDNVFIDDPILGVGNKGVADSGIIISCQNPSNVIFGYDGSESEFVVAYSTDSIEGTTLTPDASQMLDFRVYGDIHSNTLTTVGDVIVGGNLEVRGNTTFLNVDNLAVEDAVIKVAANNQVNTLDMGVVMERPEANVAVVYRGDERELMLAYTTDDPSGVNITPATGKSINVHVYGELFVDAGINAYTTSITANTFIGDGGLLSNLVTDLQSVTENGADSDKTIVLTNATEGINADSNIVSRGYYFGNGEFLTGVSNALVTNALITSNTTTLNLNIASNVNTINGSIHANVSTINDSIYANTNTLNLNIASNVNTINGSIHANVSTINDSIYANTNTLNLNIASNVSTINGSIHANVSTINDSIYANTTTLNLNIASNVSTINSSIHANVSTINDSIYANATTLNLNIASNVSTINDSIYANATTLNLNIASNVNTINDSIYANATTLNLNIASNVNTINDSIYANATTLNLNIASNVNTVNQSIDANATTLNLNIASNVNTINDSIYANATTLNLNIASNVSTINDSIYANAATLNLNIASNVSTINDSIYANATTLNLNIASNVSTINDSINANVSTINNSIYANVSTINNSINANVSTINNSIYANVSTINDSIYANVATLYTDITTNVNTLNDAIDLKADILDPHFTSNITVGSNVTTSTLAVSTLTEGRVPYVGTNSFLTDHGDLTFTQGAPSLLSVAGDVNVSGNLTVQGTTTLLTTENTAIKDAIVELGKENTSDTLDMGLIMQRPSANVALGFRGDEQEFMIGHTLSSASASDLVPDTGNALAVHVYGSFEVGTSNLFVKSSTGMVGVRTNIPTFPLHVAGDAKVDVLNATGLSVAPDTDITGIVGRAKIGYMGIADVFGVSHVDHATATNYALLQDSSGHTYINAPTGTNIHFSEAGATKMKLSGGKLGLGIDTPQFTLDVGGDANVATINAYTIQGVQTLIVDSENTDSSPVRINTSRLQQDVGVIAINDTSGNASTIQFAYDGTARVGVGRDVSNNFYITVHDGASWRDQTLVANAATGYVSIEQKLGVGTNVFTGSNVLEIDGTANAVAYWGDGGLLSNIAATLDEVCVNSNTTTQIVSLLNSHTALTTDLTSNVGIKLNQLANVNIITNELFAEQRLIYDGSNWINDYNDNSFIRVHNNTGADIPKGKTLYVFNSFNNNVANVALAKSDDPSTMPCIGISTEIIPNGQEGLATTYGKVQNVNTSGFVEGQTLYVSNTVAGGIMATKPFDTINSVDQIQNLGICVKANSTKGIIFVTGIGRSNDIPNANIVTQNTQLNYVYVNKFNNDMLKIEPSKLLTKLQTLQQVTETSPTTDREVSFTNTGTWSLKASGNIYAASNITALEFYGDGTKLDGVALKTNTNSNAARVSVLENNVVDLWNNVYSNASILAGAVANVSVLQANVVDLWDNVYSNASILEEAVSDIQDLENTRATYLDPTFTSNISVTNVAYVSKGLVVNNTHFYAHSGSMSNPSSTIGLEFASNVFYARVMAQLVYGTEDVNTLVLELQGGKTTGGASSKDITVGTLNKFGDTAKPWSTDVITTPTGVTIQPTDLAQDYEYEIMVEYTSPAPDGKLSAIKEGSTAVKNFAY